MSTMRPEARRGNAGVGPASRETNPRSAGETSGSRDQDGAAQFVTLSMRKLNCEYLLPRSEVSLSPQR